MRNTTIEYIKMGDIETIGVEHFGDFNGRYNFCLTCWYLYKNIALTYQFVQKALDHSLVNVTLKIKYY